MDGFDLGTLQSRVENLSPCLILVKVARDGSPVLAMFTTAPLGPASPKTRGDMGCFVARLDTAHSSVYRHDPSYTASNDFALSSRDCMVFGGTEEGSSHALRIESSLRTGEFLSHMQLCSTGNGCLTCVLSCCRVFWLV
jgi:hypothetical protein